MVLISMLLFAFLQVHIYGNFARAYGHGKINYSHGHRDIDDSCVLKYGRIGRCVDVDSCPGGREKLQQFPDSDLCGVFYSHPIVCCEIAQQPVTPAAWSGSVPNQKYEADRLISISTTTTATTATSGTTTTATTATSGTTTTPTTATTATTTTATTPTTATTATTPTTATTATTATTTTTTELSSSSSDNGRVPADAAIGGEEALPLEFPHMAILGYGDPQQVKWRCGGSLISENFVMTAAHCIQRGGEVRYVVLGAHQLSNATNKAVQAFRVNNTYIHPQYVKTARYHDLALIELDRPANLQTDVDTAHLHFSKYIESKILIATGWGATEVFGDNSDTLQKVNLTVVPFETCARSYTTDRRLPDGINDDWQLCADGGGERRDTCQGDSGGPLQVRRPGDLRYTIIGITSLGLQCASVPAVYTRVSNYLQWIRTTARLS